MKILICVLFMLTSCLLQAQNNFYDLSVIPAMGRVVSLSDYKGKKVLIVVASPTAIQAKNAARYLGKVQAAYPQIAVLVLQTADTGKVVDSAVIANPEQLQKLSNTRFVTLTAAGKDKGSAQHPLLQWLTHSDSNRHFDLDITGDEQFFVISESGVLYAVLEKGAPDEALKTVLETGDIKPQQVITGINRQ
jgi:glutathione peroxidase-family protein